MSRVPAIEERERERNSDQPDAARRAWGRQMGCDYAFVDSREAWQRILKPAGFDTYKVALIKEL